MGDKLPASDKATVESAIEALKTAVTANDIPGMNKAMEQLTQAQHKAAANLYQQAAPGAGAPGGGPAGGSSGGGDGSAGRASSAGGSQGDVIDAEVVDEEKR